jgi:hypothetical protein
MKRAHFLAYSRPRRYNAKRRIHRIENGRGGAMELKTIVFGCLIIFAGALIGCSVEVTDDGDLAIVGPDETFENLENRLDGCEGADNLRDRHAEILRTAGWYNYVRNHAARIDYYDWAEFGDGTVGYAHCGGCYIEVATRGRDDVYICATIVHEAAHLDEDCMHGEAWAEEAERRFLADYAANAEPEEPDEDDLEIRPAVAGPFSPAL